MFQLDQASLGLSREYLVKGTDEKIVAAYYRYMVDIAVLFGADRQRASKELQESLDFEIGLAKISLPLEERRDAAKLYNPMKIADLQEKFPSIPWQEYLNTLLKPLSIRQDDIIIVNSPKYLSDLEAILSTTPKRYKIDKLCINNLAPVIHINENVTLQLKHNFNNEKNFKTYNQFNLKYKLRVT